MLIIEHRQNEPNKKPHTPYAEIDVQINNYGHVVVQHDPDECFLGETSAVDGMQYCHLEDYLEQSGHEKFFVDIKQNLKTHYIRQIADILGDRCLGFFDVPFPSMYFVMNDGHKVYKRLSEYEYYDERFSQYWVDPLRSQDSWRLISIIGALPKDSKAIIASPELHGHDWKFTKGVWETLKKTEAFSDIGQIEGIVTKYSKSAERYFNA